MPTPKQIVGKFGEQRVVKDCACPSCKRECSLVCLPPNFKCADVICDFCGYLAQVKTATTADPSTLPKQVMGAAWGPQRERMESGIYFPLFLVLATKTRCEYSIYYLSADLQTEEIFKPRKPLSPTAKRAGWQGFMYDLKPVKSKLIRLHEHPPKRPAAA